MKLQFVVTAAGALAAAALVLAWGPLDPPPGPPQPTMHTLDDIYERVAQGPGIQVWDYVRTAPPAQAGVYAPVVEGSGVLHALIRSQSNGDMYTVRDGDGTRILEIGGGDSTRLDIRYKNGLQIARVYHNNGSIDPVLFLYLPDPG